MAPKTKRKNLAHPFQAEPEIRNEPTAVEAPAGQAEIEARPLFLPWLTWEVLWWAVIIGLALALRLWQLAGYPLSEMEAAQSLVAWQLYRGGQPEPGIYSPLLVTLNSLAFVLFGASDASARLASVLLGTALVALPLTLRRRLGRLACLLAGVLLAISPVAVFLSRTVNGDVGVAVASVMLVSGFFNWAEEGQRRWLWLLAGGLALLLAAGPMAYSVLLVFALIVLVKLPLFRALWRQGLDRAEPVPAASAALAVEPGEDPFFAADTQDEAVVKPEPAEAERPEAARPQVTRQAGIFLLVTLVLLATAGLFNLSGFSVLGNLPLDWLGRFGFSTRGDAGFNAVFLLTIYEPLLVFAGLAGLTLAILRSHEPLQFCLSLWLVGLLVLDLLMGGRSSSSAILPLVPLAFLAAQALAGLVESLRRWGTWGNEGLLLATGLVIAAFAYISLTGWLVRECAAEDRLCQLAWLQPLAALLLFVIVLVFFWLITEGGAVFRGAALVGIALGLLISVNVGTRLNYGPLENLAFHPLAGVPASPELLLLTETLASRSAWRVGDETLLETSLVGATGSALPWRLRNYANLRQVSSVTEVSETAAAIITPATTRELGRGQGYVGQDFALDAIWSPVGLPGKELVKWLIYREVNVLPLGNRAILWLKVEN